MKRITPILFALALTGCVVSPIFYQYDGPRLASSDEAVLFFTDKDSLFVKELDGKELANPYTTWNGGYSAVRELHILPGRHTVTGTVSKGNIFVPYALSHDFVAGHRYHLTPKQYGYNLKVVIVDNNTSLGITQ